MEKDLAKQVEETGNKLIANIKQTTEDLKEVIEKTNKFGEQLTKAAEDVFIFKSIK